MSTPIDISEDGGVRYLHFGSEWVQGAMRIRRPHALELAYTREMMAGLLLRDADAWPRTALVIGLGAASLTRFLHHHCPQTRTQVVEIEARVVAAARQFFKLPDEDQRLAVHVGDGVRYVMETERKFDLILVDGFDRNARAGALATQPFYEACRARLAEDGVLAVNLFGQLRGFKTQLKRIGDAFDGRVLALPESDSGNVVALAARGEAMTLSTTALRERAMQLKADTGLDLVPTLKRLEKSASFLDDKVTL